MPSIVFRANVARSVRARCAVSTWSLGASAREAHRGPVGGGGAEAGRHTLDTGNAFVRERPENGRRTHSRGRKSLTAFQPPGDRAVATPRKAFPESVFRPQVSP